MSTFGNLISGGLGYPPLDDSHQPFKRANFRPGLPAPFKGRSDHEQKKWDCKKKTKYTQVCKYIGPLRSAYNDKAPIKRPKDKVVRVNKVWKKKYNKRYAKAMKARGGETFRANKKAKTYHYKRK